MKPTPTSRGALALCLVSALLFGGHALARAEAGAAVAPAPAKASAPALWVVRDADTTIYLFGTLHLLRPETNWRTPVLDDALAATGELWIEAEEPSPAALQALIAELGIDLAHPLPSRLTGEEQTRLSSIATSLGMPANGLDPMRPWLASLVLSVVPAMKAGFDPAKGVDKAVRAVAIERGIPVRTLETAEQQIRYLAGLPDEVQMRMLREGLADIEAGPVIVERIATAWAAGDMRVIEDIMVNDLKAESGDLYKALIVDRNQRWAVQIERRLDDPGVAFVAVGAGHLVGPDRLQSLLDGEGVSIVRLQ
jgi:uncharacterized protein YbaP (TraB family)